jgi:hypothetical protein
MASGECNDLTLPEAAYVFGLAFARRQLSIKTEILLTLYEQFGRVAGRRLDVRWLCRRGGV